MQTKAVEKETRKTKIGKREQIGSQRRWGKLT